MNNQKSNNDNEKPGNNSTNNNSLKKDGGNQEKKGNNNNNNQKNQNQNHNSSGGNQGGSKNDSGILKQLLNLLERWRKGSRTYPLDSPVLYLLYRAISVIFYHLGLISILCVFTKDPIVCIEGFNASKPVEQFLLNICHSYPFLLESGNSARRYILFYKWIPYVLLFTGLLSYLPRTVMKFLNYKRLHSLLTDLGNMSHIYDNTNWKRHEDKITHYFKENMRNHGNLFAILVLNHILALAVIIGIFVLLDFTLQGRFITLPMDILPFNRDPQEFLDHLSLAFPPFVDCQIARIGELGMKGKRDDTYKCHLTIMELYEKFFFIIWFLLVAYFIIGALSVFVLLCVSIPPFNQFFLNGPSQSPGTRGKCKYLLRKLSIGDIYCLYLIKKRITPVQFCNLIDSIHTLVFNQRKEKADGHTVTSKVPAAPPHEIGFGIPIPPPTPPSTRNRKLFRNVQRGKTFQPDDIFGEDIV